MDSVLVFLLFFAVVSFAVIFTKCDNGPREGLTVPQAIEPQTVVNPVLDFPEIPLQELGNQPSKPLHEYINQPRPETTETDPQAIEENDLPQGTIGWCYTGQMRGAEGPRGCAPVGKMDKCMSGQIFPSQLSCLDNSK
jgi:hypothetical protein